MSESTKPQNKDYRFCSQCKHSEYVRPLPLRELRLYCEYLRAYHDPNAEIGRCPFFNPERLADAPLKTRDEWLKTCKVCGIKRDERQASWPE